MDLFRMRLLLYMLSIFLIIGYSPLPQICYAQTEESKDNLLDGFDDMVDDGSENQKDELLNGFEDLIDESESQKKPAIQAADKQATATAKKSVLDLGGNAKAAASYNFARKPPGRGLHHLKSELLLKGDYKTADGWQLHAGIKGSYDFVYLLNGREKYTQQTIDAYESELELRKAYLQGSLTPNLDLKVGRQIVIWGRSDNIRVVDVINPMDLREPGITDIEDLRLPVTMTKLDYYLGPFNLSGMLIHEVRVSKVSPYGSEFYPLNFPPPPEDIPPSRWENTQYAAALNGIFSGWDLSFYWADLYSATPHVEFTTVGSSPSLVQKHARYNIAGSAASVVLGNYLLKGETAWLRNLKFTNIPDKTYNRLDILLGLEYFGFANTQLALEIANQHLFDYDARLGDEPDKRDMDQLQWAARLTRNFMNERLALTLLISVYGKMWQDGAVQRLSAEYDFTDALMVNCGIVFYQSGDLTMFRNVEYNDRLFFEFKYSF